MRVLRGLVAVGIALALVPACDLGADGLAALVEGDGGPTSAGADASATTTATIDASPAQGGSGSSSGSSPDGGTSSASGSSSGGGSSSGSGSSSGGGCDASAGCSPLPSGWSLVAFATSQSAPCPSGFASAPPADVVESPSASVSACGCGACSVTTSPTCPTGPIASSYDVHATQPGTCSVPFSPLANSPPGACGSDLYVGSYGGLDLAYTPPAATGGQCTSPGAVVGAPAYGALERECLPDSAGGCIGTTCGPALPSPYAACVAQAGSAPCPAGTPYTQRHLVGTSGAIQCGDCSCTVSAACTGTMELFSEMACQGAAIAVTADGSCVNEPSSATVAGGDAIVVYSYEYVANPPSSVGCAAEGPSAATVTLVGEQTVCCAL